MNLFYMIALFFGGNFSSTQNSRVANAEDRAWLMAIQGGFWGHMDYL
jgi:hypothetical protein